MNRVFSKGGKIVNSKESFDADILIEDEKISKIFKNGEVAKLDEGTKIVDASGKLIFPGFIDAHTHFDLHVAGTVTCDNFYSGTRAAISGGTTTIIDFGTQYKGETLNEGMDNWLKKAEDGVFCDYGIHMSISDWNEEAKRQCQDMMDRGVTTFKIYLTYDILLHDNEAFEVLQRLKEVGAITGVHCENAGLIFALQQEFVEAGLQDKVSSHYKTRPAAAEAEAINRILHLAEVAGSDIIDVHLTCKEGLDEIRAARERGQKVYAETCPQYLTMTNSLYELPGFEGAKYVIAPPLREQADIDELWKAIADGEIQTVATDHCSFTSEQKKLGMEDFRKIPGGMPGVETRGIVMYSEGVAAGRISAEKMCEVLCENPAKLYGLYDRKGFIEEGFDADIVILDPKAQTKITATTQVSKCDYAPLEGKVLSGHIDKVFLRGSEIVDNAKIKDTPEGKFLARKPYQKFL